jgi:hypothetical protein
VPAPFGGSMVTRLKRGAHTPQVLRLCRAALKSSQPMPPRQPIFWNCHGDSRVRLRLTSACSHVNLEARTSAAKSHSPHRGRG